MMTTPGERVRVGVVGTGALGRHHVRLLAGLPGAELVGVVDSDAARAAEIAGEHGTVVLPDVATLLAQADAVVVAAPTVAHAELGLAALRAGRHVLVEKPIAASLDEADELVAAARAAGKVLAVGHVEFHNPAVQALLASGAPARFVEAQRLGVFTPRSLDVDVVLDLMIHDLQILHALDPSPVVEVRATGIAVLSAKVDICNARVELASGCVATLTASRVSAERVRKLRVFQPASYVSLDYREQEIKGFQLLVDDTGRRQIAPADLPVEKDEPLRRELLAFVAACRGEQVRYASGEDGRRALATALAIVAAIGSPLGLGREEGPPEGGGLADD